MNNEKFLLWQASLRAERKGYNCLTTAKIQLFSEMRNFFLFFLPFDSSRCVPTIKVRADSLPFEEPTRANNIYV